MRNMVIITCLMVGMLFSCTFLDLDYPVITILSPADEETVALVTLITGTVTDQVGVRSVEIRIDDGEYKTVEGLSEWQYICRLTAGTHIITVRAADFSEHTSYSRITVTADTSR